MAMTNKIKIPKFGLNRHNKKSVAEFAADVLRAEHLGWDCAFLPDSQLSSRDTYVLLAAAAQATKTITLGTLLVNPVNRHPSVTASSISTVAELAPGRTVLAMGAGDTSVRLVGLKPAKIKELESSVNLIKSLLNGEDVEVGSALPAYLEFAQQVPVWIAAGGPKTLEMAGACADGVFIRVGTDVKNIELSVNKIREGAEKAGKNPSSVKIGAVFHTVFSENEEEALLMGKSMAAGYYEYSPMLINNLELGWNGDHPDELKSKGLVWPDFHHSKNLVDSGKAVDFLSEKHADAFSLRGGPNQIADQLVKIIKDSHELNINFEYFVLHPIPNPPMPDPGEQAYIERIPREVIPRVKELLMNL